MHLRCVFQNVYPYIGYIRSIILRIWKVYVLCLCLFHYTLFTVSRLVGVVFRKRRMEANNQPNMNLPKQNSTRLWRVICRAQTCHPKRAWSETINCVTCWNNYIMWYYFGGEANIAIKQGYQKSLYVTASFRVMWQVSSQTQRKCINDTRRLDRSFLENTLYPRWCNQGLWIPDVNYTKVHHWSHNAHVIDRASVNVPFWL